MGDDLGLIDWYYQCMLLDNILKYLFTANQINKKPFMIFNGSS